MTTPFAASLYLAQHQQEWEGHPYAVYNPLGKPIEELPFIIGFNNGGSPEWYHAVALAQDGTCLGGHCCSAEGYMRHDLGVLDGSRPDRHEGEYRKHYPDGYRMDFVSFDDAPKHELLQKAIALNKAQKAAAESETPNPLAKE